MKHATLESMMGHTSEPIHGSDSGSIANGESLDRQTVNQQTAAAAAVVVVVVGESLDRQIST